MKSIEDLIKHWNWVLPENAKNDIQALLKKQREDIIIEYTEWLCEHGYTDSDVYTEEPTAVERFLKV